MARSRPLYSSSALQIAQFIFVRSVAEPTDLWLDGDLFGDELPDGRLLLLPLRDLLLRPQTSAATRRRAGRGVCLLNSGGYRLDSSEQAALRRGVAAACR